MKRSLVEILRGAHLPYIAFNPAFARATGSVSAGVLLAQILNLDSLHGAGFYRTAEQLRADTGMKEREYKNAKDALIEGGFVTTELKGIPAKLCWSVVWNKIAMVLGEAGSESHPDRLSEKPTDGEGVQTSLDDGVQTGLDDGVQTGLYDGVQTNKKNKEKNKEKGVRSAQPTRRKPQHPTPDQVRDYVAEKKLRVDPAYFFKFYAENDWHDGAGKPVLSWKQKVLTWDKRERERQLNQKSKSDSIREVIL
jgi:hypothetical protein